MSELPRSDYRFVTVRLWQRCSRLVPISLTAPPRPALPVATAQPATPRLHCRLKLAGKVSRISTGTDQIAASATTLAHWGDWLVLAAELTLLRSRLMLPATADAVNARDEAEALRRQLIGRAEMAAALRDARDRP